MTNLATIIVQDVTNSEFLALPRRGYDFQKGDRRFDSFKRAVDHANDEASRTGVRQVVRPDVDSLENPVYLVQAIGS
jgi:hypothetical protein